MVGARSRIRLDRLEHRRHRLDAQAGRHHPRWRPAVRRHRPQAPAQDTCRLPRHRLSRSAGELHHPLGRGRHRRHGGGRAARLGTGGGRVLLAVSAQALVAAARRALSRADARSQGPLPRPGASQRPREPATPCRRLRGKRHGRRGAAPPRRRMRHPVSARLHARVSGQRNAVLRKRKPNGIKHRAEHLPRRNRRSRSSGQSFRRRANEPGDSRSAAAARPPRLLRPPAGLQDDCAAGGDLDRPPRDRRHRHRGRRRHARLLAPHGRNPLSRLLRTERRRGDSRAALRGGGAAAARPGPADRSRRQPLRLEVFNPPHARVPRPLRHDDVRVAQQGREISNTYRR